jgi:two-component system, chemotaxis family, protein-glutamate methylesterase/glutaminase
MNRIVVIGASQGGVHALRTLVSQLPPDLPAPVLAVVHVGALPSILPAILRDSGRLTASHAKNGDELRPGHILVAPPDHHMLVTDGHVELTRGPRENWARPAIDPLFRTAAEVYGPRLVGVVLTGRLNDGASGLYEIKRRGGVAVVQDPNDAEAPEMPLSALDNVDVDHCLPLSQIPELLIRLAREPAHAAPVTTGETAMDDRALPIIAPHAQTCPECGGAMREEAQGGLTRFRCHIGHVMTAEVLAAIQLESLEKDLSSALRFLNERAALCHEIAGKHAARGDTAAAAAWTKASEEALQREEAVRRLSDAEWSHPEAEPRAQRVGTGTSPR